MKNLHKLVLTVMAGLVFAACGQKTEVEKPKAAAEPAASTASAPAPAATPAVVKDSLIKPIPVPTVAEPAKVELGKKLWFDTRLSKSGALSCNSCHNLMTSGTDNLTSSIGHNWVEGPINSPTVYNSVFNIKQFWDGRADTLKAQAGGPIENPKEMASTH